MKQHSHHRVTWISGLLTRTIENEQRVSAKSALKIERHEYTRAHKTNYASPQDASIKPKKRHHTEGIFSSFHDGTMKNTSSCVINSPYVTKNESTMCNLKYSCECYCCSTLDPIWQITSCMNNKNRAYEKVTNLYNVHPARDSTEHSMLVVQPRGGDRRDEELRSVRGRTCTDKPRQSISITTWAGGERQLVNQTGHCTSMRAVVLKTIFHEFTCMVQTTANLMWRRTNLAAILFQRHTVKLGCANMPPNDVSSHRVWPRGLKNRAPRDGWTGIASHFLTPILFFRFVQVLWCS